MNYLVIAKHWDDETQKYMKYVKGEFPRYYLASIFKKAYDDEFNSHCEIISIDEMLNDEKE